MQIDLACLIPLAALVACDPAPPSRRTSTDEIPASGVELRDGGVFVDGARVADAPSKGVKRIGPLFDLLKAKREAWKKAHPDHPFSGAQEVALPEGATCKQALSIITSVAYAGYPNLTVRIGGGEATPLPYDRVMDDRTPTHGLRDEARRTIHAWLRASGAVAVRHEACYAAYDEVPAAEIVRPIRELQPKLQTLVLGCDDDISFRAAHDAFDRVRRELAAPELALALAGSCSGVAEELATEGTGIMPPLAVASPPHGQQPLPPDKIGKAVVVVGGIEAPEPITASLKRGVERIQPQLAGCYAKDLEDWPAAAGKAVVEVELGRLGGVTRIDPDSANTPFADAMICIGDQISLLTVDPKPSGRVIARIPLELRPR